MTPRKPRLPGDVRDVWNVEVGKPYRGQYVMKIDVESFPLDNDRVKVRRLIHLDNEIVIIEDTWHDRDEVFADGKLLPYDQINFPSMDPADFATPAKPKRDPRDDEEKKKKREILRERAREMLGGKKKHGDPNPPPTPPPPPPKDDDDELKLRIKTPDGRMLPVVVGPTDTVDDLKERIEGEHGIPSDDQSLVHGGEPLDDPNATMKDSGIESGDVIDLAPEPMTVTVATPEGKRIPLSVAPDDTVRDVRDKLSGDHGIPSGDDGDDAHQLSFRGTPLDDPSSTLDGCGIRDGDVLKLDPTTLALTIETPDGTTMRVNARPGDTVSDLKERIERDREIPIPDQSLAHRGTPLDDPDSTMEGSGIKNGDTLVLRDRRMTVEVRKPDGTTFPLAVRPEDTVRTVQKQIESKDGTPVSDQALSYEGNPLESPGTTLEDLGVSDGDVLDLSGRRGGGGGGGDLGAPPKARAKTKTKTKDKARVRKLNPDSAWVFPTKESAPSKGEEENLRGIWSVPPNASDADGTDPVEVNIHPLRKEPTNSTGDTVHGAYGYVNGAKPDANGVVDPGDVAFYPPGDKAFRPDFDQAGWWSAPESSSKTKVKWWFEGDDMVHHRTHTVKVCGHEMTFESRYIK